MEASFGPCECAGTSIGYPIELWDNHTTIECPVNAEYRLLGAMVSTSEIHPHVLGISTLMKEKRYQYFAQSGGGVSL